MSRDSFRRAVNGGTGPWQDMIEVVVKLRPGWSFRSWLAVYRLAHPPAWWSGRPLLGVGSTGPRRSDESPFTWEVVLAGVSEPVHRWLLVWSGTGPDRLFDVFCVETSEYGEVRG